MMATQSLFLITSLLAVAYGQGRGALRLYRNGLTSTSFTAGILEIYFNGIWGNICNDFDFAGTEANVACHQLGYDGYSTYGSSGVISSYGNDTSPTLLDNVDCTHSGYLVLLQCSYSTVILSICTNYHDVYVSCYATRIWNNPYSGQIRLTGGSYAGQGLLEVYCNGRWGTVCDDTFDGTDANVACRQLGYTNHYRYAYNSSLTGTVSQPIWLDYVYCSSSTTSCLAYCQSCPSSQNHNCAHSEDITLECEFSSAYTSPYATLGTCQYADVISSTVITPLPSTISTPSISTSSSLGGIVGGVIVVTVIICILVIAIPLCIFCCAGIGVGAAFKQSSQRNIQGVTTIGASTVAMSTVTTSQQQIPPPVNEYTSPDMTAYPATGFSQQPPPAYPATGYPPYPTQQPMHPPYPTQQPMQPQFGYPTQQAQQGYTY